MWFVKTNGKKKRLVARFQLAKFVDSCFGDFSDRFENENPFQNLELRLRTGVTHIEP